MTWQRLIFGGVGKILGGRMIYVYLIIGAGLISGSFYGGYSYCDYWWQSARNEALEEALQRAGKYQQKLADAQNALAEVKQARKVVYREKIKYIIADAPDCELHPDRMQELVCAVRPSTCKR